MNIRRGVWPMWLADCTGVNIASMGINQNKILLNDVLFHIKLPAEPSFQRGVAPSTLLH